MEVSRTQESANHRSGKVLGVGKSMSNEVNQVPDECIK